MRKYELKQSDIEILMDSGDLLDFIEGVLLDNYVFYSDKFTGFIFEEYVNSNSSKNVLYMVPNSHKNIIKSMWDRFYSLA